MDRRAFLRRTAPAAPAAPPPEAPPSEPFEVLPGVFADPGIPVQWRARAERGDRPARSVRRAPDLGVQSSDLTPYVPSASMPWDRSRALHLLRRTGYGTTPEAVEQALNSGPNSAVNGILGRATTAAVPPTPYWNDSPPPRSGTEAERQAYVDDTFAWTEEKRREVYDEALDVNNPGTAFRERMAMFWHNHFVTHRDTYFLAPWLHRYWALLRRNALGDFKQFVHEMGIEPAMLVYLNGLENRAGSPNENYARELLELFTMGITDKDGADNYTQEDIEELSRALTGWGVDYYGSMNALLVPVWHDDGSKTIFGQRGQFGYDDIVPLLFAQRGDQIAWFICEQLYREFVYDEPDPGVVQAMADLFQAEDYQIFPVVRALLKSAHFYDAAFVGSGIKSPFEAVFGLHRELKFTRDQELEGLIWYSMYLGDQILFEPPTVAGWPGHRAWLNTSTLPMRWLTHEWFAYQQNTLVTLARSLPESEDAAALAARIAEHLLGRPPDPESLQGLTSILLNGIPDYEWSTLQPNAENRIRGLVLHLLRQPDFQLT